jgi:hypothetical protein
MENTETRVWLDFALACDYVSKDLWKDFEDKTIEIGKLLNHMIENPEKYFRKSDK